MIGLSGDKRFQTRINTRGLPPKDKGGDKSGDKSGRWRRSGDNRSNSRGVIFSLGDNGGKLAITKTPLTSTFGGFSTIPKAYYDYDLTNRSQVNNGENFLGLFSQFNNRKAGVGI